jgi:membrane protein YdbS with pleckstrin-like domain
MENQTSDNVYRLCPRRLYAIYSLSGLIVFIFLVLATLFPLKGITVFEFGTTSLIISKIFIVIFCLLGILITGVFIWHQKSRSNTFFIKLSENSIDFTFGVFSRKTESVEMHSVDDVIYRQGPWDMFFKTADIIIYSHDYTTPVVKFDGLTIDDAHKIHDYIGEHSSDSLVKYYAKTGTTTSTPQNVQPTKNPEPDSPSNTQPPQPVSPPQPSN